ncbi:hypothetical protein B0H14DRAFT_3529334 [Mycena olivaceomarginata]|nr:hypothetical protein B0H14DRAFT_3529334 [Mycena olivaceomarginata]
MISPDPEQTQRRVCIDCWPTDDRDGDGDHGDHGGGLRDGWRALLSRDGIEYLAAALFPAPPSPSTSTPPAPVSILLISVLLPISALLPTSRPCVPIRAT